ncbi:putative GP4d helicase [Vibrio phage 275E43-1]|nr:putative GP4d helicase [Vibrio phage 275E43-1]
MSECVEKIDCPECGGSNLQVFLQEDGSYDGFCYSNCWKYFKDPYENKPSGYTPPAPYRKNPEEVKAQLKEVRALPVVDIPDRKLKAETLRHFGVRVGLSQEDGKTPSVMYFPHFTNGKVQSAKTKILDPKRMWWIGSKKDVEPFGWRQALNSGSTRIIVTEGEPDCLATAQVLAELEKHPDYKGKFPAVISLTDGAATAGKFFGRWLPEMKRNFKEIVFVPDTDEAGQKAAAVVSQLDPLIKIAHLDGKDPNAMLIEGRKKALRSAILFNSEVTKLDKVCTVDDLLEDAMKMPEWGYTFPWPRVTALTCGFRRKEIYGLGGGTGCGKTSWAQEMQSWIVNEHDNPVGVFMLEQPAGRTLKGIAGKFAGIPFHRPDVTFTQEQLKSAIEALRDKVYVYNNFGVIDWESVKAAIRFMNVTYGVKDFFIDNMTCFVSHVSSSEANDILNGIMGEMATLALELDITIFYFSHLNAPKTGLTHERGGHVHESQFTGSRSMQRYSHYLFGLERNKDPMLEEDERNTSTFVLLKDREFGRSGNVSLFYNMETDQMREIDPDREPANDDTPITTEEPVLDAGGSW